MQGCVKLQFSEKEETAVMFLFDFFYDWHLTKTNLGKFSIPKHIMQSWLQDPLENWQEI